MGNAVTEADKRRVERKKSPQGEGRDLCSRYAFWARTALGRAHLRNTLVGLLHA